MRLLVDLSNLSYFQHLKYDLYAKSVNSAGTSSKSNVVEFDNRVQLDAPTNVAIFDDTITFDAVTNATSYDIYSDTTLVGNFVPTDLSAPEVNITSLLSYINVTAGQHSLTVKAKSNDYRTSNASAAVTFTKFTAPSNESVTNDTYEFDEITNAEMYDIYAAISGVDTYIGTHYVNDYTYSFENGVLTIYNAPHTFSSGILTIE